MGEPGSESENRVVSPAEQVDSGEDSRAHSENVQPEFDQLPTTTDNHSHTPSIPREEDTEKVTPRHKRFSEKASDSQSRTSSGVNGSGIGVSVTLLTLDADLEPRPHSRQHFLPSPRAERDHDMSDLKLIRDFQVRRKYGRRPAGYGRPAKQPKHMPELGLSGTRYFTNGVANGVTPSLDSARTGKTSLLTEETVRLQNSSTPASASFRAAGRSRTEEDRCSVESAGKDVQSPAPSFPPLTSGGSRIGVRSENSFYSSRLNGQPPSLLSNHFGFSTIRPDTFSGMLKHRKIKLAGDSDNDDLLKELEHHAQKQIVACQNMGFTHRGSRAAENVLSLKHTVSPSAFHPSSIFTRHAPREERAGSRLGTPAEGEERPPRRRVTPAGKLSMPRLVIPDRQEKAERRTTLPIVSGSSLQVVLTQSHGK